MAKNKTNMSKEEVRQANKDLYKSNEKIADTSTVEVAKVVKKNLDSDRNKSSVDKITNIFYDNLEEVFKNTTNKLYNIYPKAKDYKVEDIFSITYNKDGKTIEERIKEYWEKAKAYLKDEVEYQEVEDWLIWKYDVLMRNETAIVERVIKQHKVKPVADYLIIEGGCTCGCGDCDSYIGEYPADETIDLPPYHPGCSCFHYYIEDENDEMEDESIDITVD